MGLRWDCVDFEKNTIEIKHTITQFNGKIHKCDSTKNDSSYAVIPLPDMIRRRLKKWKAQQAQYKWLQPNDYIDEGYICTLPNGKLMRPNYVSHHFSILLRQQALPPIRFHDLRHSSATYLKYLGFDLKDIQTWLRHKDIQTTMNIYTHLDMDSKTEIAEKLNERFVNFDF